VSLSASYDETVTVHYSTADGTATTAGNDYKVKSGTLTFLPGVTSQTITVVVNGDRFGEADENFFVNLDSPSSNASVTDAQGVGTIFDDEPRITINDVTKLEGKSGKRSFVFTVNLSIAYDQSVTVNYSTADGTATVAGGDYRATSGRLTFKPGQTSQSITVSVTGDRKKEPDETFYVNLSGASSNALIVDSQGVGTIINDDGGGGRRSALSVGRTAGPPSDAAALLSANGRPATVAWDMHTPAADARLLKAPVVDRVFAGLAEPPRIIPEVVKDHPRATAPRARISAAHGLLWNEDGLLGVGS
jgi:hypothetical protein